MYDFHGQKFGGGGVMYDLDEQKFMESAGMEIAINNEVEVLAVFGLLFLNSKMVKK